MVIIITILVLFAIALAVWLLNKLARVQICPVCAAVSGTWLLLSAGILFGYISKTDFLPIILLLMGGTIVGIAYQGEKSVAWATRNPLWWKLIVITTGVAISFWATKNLDSRVLLLETAALVVLVYLFFFSGIGKKPSLENAGRPLVEKNSGKIKAIEEKLKNCC